MLGRAFQANGPACNGHEVEIFQLQTAPNFRQMKLWVLESSILPVNSTKSEIFRPKFRGLERKFSDMATIRGIGIPNSPRHDPTVLNALHDKQLTEVIAYCVSVLDTAAICTTRIPRWRSYCPCLPYRLQWDNVSITNGCSQA